MTQQGKKGRGTPLAQEGHQPDAQLRRMPLHPISEGVL